MKTLFVPEIKCPDGQLHINDIIPVNTSDIDAYVGPRISGDLRGKAFFLTWKNDAHWEIVDDGAGAACLVLVKNS